MNKFFKILRFILRDKIALGYFAYALLILSAIFALTYAAVYPLMQQAKLVVTDTLPGMIYGAKLNSTLDDNFVRLLLAAASRSTNEVNHLIMQLDQSTQQNEAIISNYEKYVFEKDDRKTFEAFVARRNEFITQRQQFLEQLRSRPEQAASEIKPTLLPAYDKYRDAGRGLISYNERIGRERSQKILKDAFCAIVFTTIGPILIIILGIFIGIKIFRL